MLRISPSLLGRRMSTSGSFDSKRDLAAFFKMVGTARTFRESHCLPVFKVPNSIFLVGIWVKRVMRPSKICSG